MSKQNDKVTKHTSGRGSTPGGQAEGRERATGSRDGGGKEEGRRSHRPSDRVESLCPDVGRPAAAEQEEREVWLR